MILRGIDNAGLMRISVAYTLCAGAGIRTYIGWLSCGFVRCEGRVGWAAHAFDTGRRRIIGKPGDAAEFGFLFGVWKRADTRQSGGSLERTDKALAIGLPRRQSFDGRKASIGRRRLISSTGKADCDGGGT